MRTAVIGHHSRQARAERLADTLGATLFLDTGDHGATWNHLRALEWADGQRILVLEDDAEPVPDFHAHIHAWITRFPDDLCSFYLGTGYRSRHITAPIDEQWDNPLDYITHRRLLHAVCYTIPATEHIHTSIDRLKPIDFAIGDAWHNHTGRAIVYPKRSLVNHGTLPSVINPAYHTPRHARMLA